MAAINLDDLYKKYEGFYEPVARVELGGQDVHDYKKVKLNAVDFVVELSSDLKASIASFRYLMHTTATQATFLPQTLKSL